MYPGILLTLSLADTKTINNYGTWNWTSGPLIYTGAAVVNNYGTFNISTDDGQTGYVGSFNNKSTGIINKIGNPGAQSGFIYMNAFNNEGTININSGNLYLNVGGGNHTGTYNVSFGAELSGSINMPFTGSSFLNEGTVTLTGLTFNGSGAQSLHGTGSINTVTINNSTGILLTGVAGY